jgi:putative colanic acid biosysnthesis UDP-glucose lipid carrier transferase
MLTSGHRGLFNQYRWLITSLQKLFDGTVVVALLVVLCKFYNIFFSNYYFTLGIISFLLTIMIFQGFRLYRPWRGVYLGQLVRRVILAWALIATILIVLGFVIKISDMFSRRVLLTWFFLTPLVLVLLRLQVYLSLRWLRESGLNSRTAVIVGAGDLGLRLAKNVVETGWLGIRLQGFFDDARAGQMIDLSPGNDAYPVIGPLSTIVPYVKENKIDMVYLALPLRAEALIREVVEALQDTTVSVYYVPDIFIFTIMQASFTELRGIPLISIWETPFFGINGWLKRLEDIIFASIILILVSPLLLLIALGVKISSPGPIIFKQRRYGLNGKEILIYKFRTMTVCQDGQIIPQARQNDSRVTLLGDLLRRTSLDELPQFLNVLMGSMSIVGPRPHAVAHNEYYRQRIPGYMLRHKVRPGITGWAQINGWRGETETLDKMEKRIELDLEYLRRWSLWFDIKIIWLTIFGGFSSSKAY